MSDLATSVTARLAEWDAHRVGGRIWDHDPTVWAEAGTPEITNRLGWLDLPTSMRPRIGEWVRLAEELGAEGVTDVVLLGMGGSSLAPEVLTGVLPSEPTEPRLTVLDSTHPAAVCAVADRLAPETTMFVVSSKSGGTLETLSLFRFFWAWRAGVDLEPGDGFIAVTDPGSGLSALADERGFRAVFEADPNVGGRFSALTDFGMVPFTLAGGDPGAVLELAARMADACGRSVPPSDHVGLDLGAWIGEAAIAGIDKLTIVTSDSLRAFPAWWEQLVAESTGKAGLGVVPVDDRVLRPPDTYGPDRLFLVYQLASDPPLEGVEALEIAGFPIRVINMRTPAEIGAEMYRAEFAVAAVGAALGINPFDQPDVEAAKISARGLMEGAEVDVVLATTPLEEVIERAGPGDYLAIMAFVPQTEATERRLHEIAEVLTERTGVAVTVGFGPRFLHSTGQLHKGGPNTCIAIQVLDVIGRDVPVPESELTFGRIITAQAAGDAAVLIDRGRPVARTTLEELEAFVE